MSEETIKETATTYTNTATRLAVPPEWNWLRAFSAADQAAFFQEADLLDGNIAYLDVGAQKQNFLGSFFRGFLLRHDLSFVGKIMGRNYH